MSQSDPTMPLYFDVVRRIAPVELGDDAAYAGDPLGWLTHDARTVPHLAALLDGFAQRLRRAGIALARLSIHIGTVHPQFVGYDCIWSQRGDYCQERKIHHAALETDRYRRGPLRPVIEDGALIRRDPRLPEAQAEFPLMADLDAEGITDYVARSLGMMSDVHIALSYSTDAPQRFAPEALALIEHALPLLALHLDLRIMSNIAGNVLDAYVGRRAGARVLRGEILRGKGERIDAVIWASDLRDFSGLSERLTDADMIALLNAYFERLVDAIEAHGGEVLKFIGDGILAIFPIDPAAPGTAAEAAIAASGAALAALDRLNGEESAALPIADAWRPLRTGIALHRGEVYFGNIGAPGRLDFTVIGTAVNLAARVEPLTKTLGHTVLLTEPVAGLSARPLLALGSFPLRGVSLPVAVFALASPAAALRPSP